jgi:ribonucleoside-diphosphate reductase alpha chain
MKKLSTNALAVLKKRGYLKRGETVEKMFRRVAKLIAEGTDYEKEFYQIMSNLEYLSGSVLLNAGKKYKQFSACYVLPLEDSLEDIYTQLRNAALITRTGGGLGIPLSNLRPRGSEVKSTGGISGGAVSFAKLFNASAEAISEGSSRRPAMMGVMAVDHPDIEEFIRVKADGESLQFFNVSVGVKDDFMRRVKKDNGTARLFDLIGVHAWQVGDPGMVFLDRMNRDNPTPHLGEYETTNPCGEQPLLPYESCNLGNINLGKFVEEDRINWKRLKKVIHLGVRFQDKVIDVCDYPILECEEMAKRTRRIGLGVMGWADMLIKLEIPYDSKRALGLAERVAKFIQEEGRKASAELGKEKGSFQEFEKSIWAKKYSAMRNATINTVAPTGTVSIIGECSSGIEPLFGLAYQRNVLEGETLQEVNENFKVQMSNYFKSRSKIKDQKLKVLREVIRTGSCQQIKELPVKIRRVFKIAQEIDWQWHIKMQAAWQKYTDTAVSKTINMPNEATVEEVKEAYRMAWELGCKGVTVYRDGCREKQVLNLGHGEICNECGENLNYEGGCVTCPNCGWSKCAL